MHFPDTFKLAEVSSPYEKNDNLHKGNHRTVIVSKINERVMAVQLCDFSTIYFQLFCLHSAKSIAVSLHC